MAKGTIHIGTSGFYYEHWRGLFYPNDLPKTRFFDYYVQHFSTVELNSTFYHLPRQKTTEHWMQKSPDDFLFSLKAYRGITHYKKLEEVDDELYRFLHLIKPMKPKLGSILFQLPPSLHYDLPRLESFFNILPRGYRYTIEFRHPSWLVEETYTLLKAFNVALCLNDYGKRTMEPVVTADFVYLRFHGPTGRYGGSYDDETLKEWAQKIVAWAQEGRDLLIYFNNDTQGYAVQNAFRLQEIVGLTLK